MNSKWLILKSLWLPGLIAFISILIPNTLFAGPAPKCPCFSTGEIDRALSKAAIPIWAELRCKYYDGSGDPLGTDWDGRKIAELFIPTSSGGTIYSMFGSVVYDNITGFPACGTVDIVFDIGSDGYPIAGTGTYKLTINEIPETSTEVMLACYNAILDAYPTCNLTTVSDVLDIAVH